MKQALVHKVVRGLLGCVCMCAQSLLFVQVHAESAKSKPIQGLLYCAAQGSAAIFLGQIGNDASGIQKAEADAQAAKKCLDDGVESAVRAAGKHADLTKAVKEYYASASAFLQAGVTVSKILSERLKSDMEVKEQALRLELKLAKMD